MFLKEDAPIPTKGKGKTLSGKQLLFVEAYCDPSGDTFQHGPNSVAAAGYAKKTQARTSFSLLRHPLVIKTIRERMEARKERMELTADYVIHKLMTMIESDEDKMKHADTIRALELLGKSLALWKERQEISGPDGEAIRYEQEVKENVEDFTSKIGNLADRFKPKVVNLKE